MDIQKFKDRKAAGDAVQRAEWRRFNTFTIAPMTFEEYQRTSNWGPYCAYRNNEERK